MLLGLPIVLVASFLCNCLKLTFTHQNYNYPGERLKLGNRQGKVERAEGWYNEREKGRPCGKCRKMRAGGRMQQFMQNQIATESEPPNNNNSGNNKCVSDAGNSAGTMLNIGQSYFGLP